MAKNLGHYGGGPVTGGIGKVGAKPAGPPNSGVKTFGNAPAVTKKITIGKGGYLHGEMKGQSSGSHGGNVKAGKYHKPFSP